MDDLKEIAAETLMMGEAFARIALRSFYDEASCRYDARIWSDAYVLGVVQGMIAGQCLPAINKGLDEVTVGMVVLDAMLGIGADDQVLALSERLISQHDATFAQGHEDAIKATLILCGTLPAQLENASDVLAAKGEMARARAEADLLPGMEMDDPLAHAIAYMCSKVEAHRRRRYLS
jgi:hypothetical protein